MTYRDKTAVLVEKLFDGKWPRHTLRYDPYSALKCERCHAYVPEPEDNDQCVGNFDPFTRLEDAFAVVERLMAQNWSYELGDRSASGHTAGFYGGGPLVGSTADTPARAIAEAAYLVVTS